MDGRQGRPAQDIGDRSCCRSREWGSLYPWARRPASMVPRSPRALGPVQWISRRGDRRFARCEITTPTRFQPPVPISSDQPVWVPASTEIGPLSNARPRPFSARTRLPFWPNRSQSPARRPTPAPPWPFPANRRASPAIFARTASAFAVSRADHLVGHARDPHGPDRRPAFHLNLLTHLRRLHCSHPVSSKDS